MLHIQLIVAPATGHVLTSQQQLPGGIGKTVRLVGEAAAGSGGAGHAAAREDISINSTL